MKRVAKRLAEEEIQKIRAKNAMIRDRKIFLEKQCDWKYNTKRTLAEIQKSIRSQVKKKKTNIAEEAKKPTDLTCVIEEGSDDVNDSDYSLYS